LFGGLYAVIGTDFIQSLIILIGLVAMAVTVLMHTSTQEIHVNLTSNRPMLLNALFPAAIMAIFNNMLFGIGEIFHSNVWWSRAFAMREGVGGKAYVLAGLIWLPIPIVAGFLGLAAPSLGINIPRADVAGPIVAAQLLGFGGAILVFVIVFCSLASSIDSLLAATSDVVTTEVIKPLFMRDADEPQIRKAASVVILCMGMMTWLLCLKNNSTLADVLFFAGPLVGSTIWPILTGLYWRRASGIAAVLAMVVGSGVGLIAYFEIGWYAGALVGTGVSCIITLVGAAVPTGLFDWRKLRTELTDHDSASGDSGREVME
jgi:Na+/proline symporter